MQVFSDDCNLYVYMEMIVLDFRDQTKKSWKGIIGKQYAMVVITLVDELLADCPARIFTCAIPSLGGILGPFLAYSANGMAP